MSITEEALVVAGRVEVLTSADDLFEQGKQIGANFGRRLQATIDKFYEAAIPFAYRVLEERPWLSEPYRHYSDPDPYAALRNFLRAALHEGEGRDRTAERQAGILAMLVQDGLDAGAVRGIHYSYLLTLSYAMPLVSQKQRGELLEAARTSRNHVEFSKRVEIVKRGLLIEETKVRYLAGPRSADRQFEEYDRVTREGGDNRPLMERVGDTLGAAVLTESDPVIANWHARSIAAFCRYQRRSEVFLANSSDQEILGFFCFASLRMAARDHDPETHAEYEELVRSKPK